LKQTQCTPKCRRLCVTRSESMVPGCLQLRIGQMIWSRASVSMLSGRDHPRELQGTYALRGRELQRAQAPAVVAVRESRLTPVDTDQHHHHTAWHGFSGSVATATP